MPSKPTIDYERVRQLLAQGVMQKHIAIRLGVSKGCISRIVSGKSTRKEA